MKIPKWFYPKDALSLKYIFHLLIIAIIFESLWLITGHLFPNLFVFAMPLLTLESFCRVILSPMTVVVTILIGLSDIIAHSSLKLN